MDLDRFERDGFFGVRDGRGRSERVVSLEVGCRCGCASVRVLKSA